MRLLEQISRNLKEVQKDGDNVDVIVVTERIHKRLTIESLGLCNSVAKLKFGTLTYMLSKKVFVYEDVKDAKEAVLLALSYGVNTLLVHDEETYFDN